VLLTIPLLYSQLDVSGVTQLLQLGPWGVVLALTGYCLRWLLSRLREAEQREREAWAEVRRLDRQIADERAESARALLEIATRSQDQPAALQWGRGRDSSDRR
jgi:hypothetical protein